jgi:predicted DNA-binding transcriptional regulator AlpA
LLIAGICSAIWVMPWNGSWAVNTTASVAPVAAVPAIPAGDAPQGGPAPASLSVASADEMPAPTAAEREREANRQRRMARSDEVTALAAQGLGIATIAKRLGMARKTVRRFLRAGRFPERVQRTGQSGRLAVFEAYLRQR